MQHPRLGHPRLVFLKYGGNLTLGYCVSYWLLDAAINKRNQPGPKKTLIQCAFLFGGLGPIGRGGND